MPRGKGKALERTANEILNKVLFGGDVPRPADNRTAAERYADEYAAALEAASKVGRNDPWSSKFVVGDELIWQSNPGMQSEVFFWSNPSGPLMVGRTPDPVNGLPNKRFICDEILCGGPRGPGKALPLDGAVCTPFGMQTMGSMRVGSLVSNPDGSVANVIGVYPQGERDCYRVTFSDGATVICDADHLWLARRMNGKLKADRRYAPFEEEDRVPYRVFTTRAMLDLMEKQSHKTWADCQRNFLVPLAKPTEFTSITWNNNKAGILDPYVVGALLGNGCLNKEGISFSTADQELVDELHRRTGIEITTVAKYQFRFKAGKTDFIARLESLGLVGKRSWEKLVPEMFKTAPASVRLELVQGLMDTDGCADSRDGSLTYCSVSLALATDMQYLLRSLGFRASMRKKQAGYRNDAGDYVECRDAYELSVQGADPASLFKTQRKKDNCRKGRFNGSSDPHRRIENIESVGKRECQCITVDHPNGLFLTNDFVVTHNSSCGMMWVAQFCKTPGYVGLILRKSNEELKETIEKFFQYYKKMGAVMRAKPTEFYWPESGAVIYTGYLEKQGHFEQYRGNEYHRILFEEAQHIPKESLYSMVKSSNRSTVPGIRAQTLLTANPDGPGAHWLKARFVKVINDENGEYMQPKTPFLNKITNQVAIYLPGKISDNPQILENDPDYVHRLADPAVEEWRRKAWIDGDWDAASGSFFPTFRARRFSKEPKEALHVIPAFNLPPWCHRWIGMDWGHNHHTAVYWFCVGPDKRIHIEKELVVSGAGSDELGAEIAEMSLDYLRGMKMPLMRAYLSPDAFDQRDKNHTIAGGISEGVQSILGPGSSVLMDFTDAEKEIAKTDVERAVAVRTMRLEKSRINDKSIWFTRANDSRKAGWEYIRRLLRWVPLQRRVDPDMEFAHRIMQRDGVIAYRNYLAQFDNQKEEVLPMLQIHDCCPVLIETFPKLFSKPEDPDDVEKFDSTSMEIGDDPADACRYGLMGHLNFESKIPKEVYLEDEVQRIAAKGDPTDMTRLAQIARAAEARYDKRNQRVDSITLPRDAISLRRLPW